jgi:hypothetical protein
MFEFDQEILISFGLVLVGLIWGVTNPYIEKGSNSEE